MLYVSKVFNNSIYIIDTDDNTESLLSESEIREALSLGIRIQGAVLNNDKLYIKEVSLKCNSALELAKRKLVDSIWKSANLEGLGTTFQKTKAILENIQTSTSREEVLFIVSMKRAWQFLFDNINYPCCLMLLRQLNKLIGDGLFNSCGEIRIFPVLIGGTNWVPDIPVESLICKNIEELNKETNARLKALKYFCYIARAQIFCDGNKRVAQLIANKILIENNIGIFQIPIDRLEDFKYLLIDFYESDEDMKIIDFMDKYCIVTY